MQCMSRRLGICVLGLLVAAFAGWPVGGADAGDLAAAARDLVRSLEPVDRQFEEYEIAGRMVLLHQRSIDGVTVEGDYINYQFDGATGALLARKAHWRDDVPAHLPAVTITRGTAEAMVAGTVRAGEVQASRLMLISPESAVFPIRPVPQNPCWIVRSMDGGEIMITVIDAVTGETLGMGVPPPYTAFSFTGPGDCPPTWNWNYWSSNAASWFNTMGYSVEGVVYPTLEQIRSHVKSDETAMFYEIAHGGYSGFNYGCEDGAWLGLPAFKVGMWIGSYAKMPFAFIASCDGMCQTGDGTFSYEFRKGSTDATVTVGYCGMSELQCDECWGMSWNWQNALFTYMNQGMTVQAAFDMAGADYPTCATNSCMRFVGDSDFAVVPPVVRDPDPPTATLVAPDGGETIEYGAQYEIRWVAEDNARVTSVTLLLSTDGGASYPDTVATGEPNDSSYLWTVPDVTSHTARIKVVALDGVPNEGSDASDADFTLEGSAAGVAVPQYAGVPGGTVLSVIGANPVGPVAAGCGLVYGVPAGSYVDVGVYDAGGRLVDHLVGGWRDAGYYRLDWSPEGRRAPALSSGIYFVRMECDAGTATIKVILAR